MFAEIQIFGINSLTQGKEEVWPGGTQPMLYIPSFRSVAPIVFLEKIHFWGGGGGGGGFPCYYGNHFPDFMF